MGLDTSEVLGFMNDMLTIQRYVLSKWLMNDHTEKIASVHKRCFDGNLEEIYTLIKKQYIETEKVDMISLGYDFEILIDIVNENTMNHFNFESCLTKLQKNRHEKALRYIGTKLSLGDITETEAIDLLNKKLEMNDEEVSIGNEVAVETYTKIMERFDKKETLRVGLNRFDSIIGDLSETGFFVLGGRPSSGKTVLALNIAEAVAKQGKKVLFFSLEMSKHKIMQRILVSNAMVENEKIKNKNVSQEDFKKLFDACNKDHLKNIHIIDKSGMTIDEIRKHLNYIHVQTLLLPPCLTRCSACWFRILLPCVLVLQVVHMRILNLYQTLFHNTILINF